MSNEKLNIAQNNFGELLRQVRKERRITLEELGKQLKISYGYIGQIERGVKQPEPLVRETIERWIETGTADKVFAVTQIYEPEKKPSSPIVSAILGIVEAMSPEDQANELKRLTDQFIAEQSKEKP